MIRTTVPKEDQLKNSYDVPMVFLYRWRKRLHRVQKTGEAGVMQEVRMALGHSSGNYI